MRSTVVLGLTALLLAAGCAAGPEPAEHAESAGPGRSPAASPARTSGGPAAGDVAHSPNVTHVANVPPAAPFDGPDSWGTDLAFQGDYAFAGNYEGFTVYDIANPERPAVVSRVLCPGAQNDVSVHGNLLFLSIDSPRRGPRCDTDPGATRVGEGWEGIRIFDITDKARPVFVSAVRTECGSHTHTLVPGDDPGIVYLYVSSPGPEPDSRTCPAPHDRFSVVEVPVGRPAAAKVVARPRVSGVEDVDHPAGCHDITVYPEKDLAAAACFGDGFLLDISDRVRPKVLQRVRDEKNFALWHSATFDNAADKVVFGDELGGGAVATCDAGTPATRGAAAVYDVVGGRSLRLRSYFKIPREQRPGENCVVHNGSLLPVPGRDVMVQSWYQGGVSIWDFTDAARPREIGFFERGPLGDGREGGSWSAYYYNGHIYSSDMTRGLDVLRVDDPLTDPARKVRLAELNAQTQVSYAE
ncbi:hypothetical protein GCM10018953_65520 [Streptosporangium nondiastaticum]|uniref:LVIVD repeat-containing protein n=1 Tax=Streptosporangium TaxID=2000 RepID=UPI0031F9C722